MQQIADGVWVENLGIANIGILELPSGGVALIDTGEPGSATKIQKALAANNWKLSDIKHILITHGHYDHIGDLEKLVQQSGATVWAHRLEAPVIRATEKAALPPDSSLNVFARWLKNSVKNKAQQAGVVHRELQGASNLEVVLPKLRAVFLPGHAPGQLGYYLEDSRTLFGGDCCMNILGLRLPIIAFTTDLREAKRSIQVAAKLEPNNLVVGHGQPIVDVAAGALERLAKRLKT
jgi:glyoxylase-like metal-dependent hydrolase (beta-lactamase superfamily II)